MAITIDDFFDDDLAKQFPEIASTSKELAEKLYPSRGLSAEEQQELASLTNQMQRLSPVEAPAVQGSTRIPGNVFSVDRSPVYNAIQQGLNRVLNARRQKQMLEPDPELSQRAAQTREAAEGVQGGPIGPIVQQMMSQQADQLSQQAQAQSPAARLQALQQKQEESQQAEELQQEMLMRLAPDLAGRIAETQKQLRTGEQEHLWSVDEIKERGAQQVEAIKERARQETGGDDEDSPQYAVGVVTGFLGQTDPISKSITSTIETLKSQLSADVAADPEQTRNEIKQLERKRAELQKWKSDAYRALSEGNLYKSDLLDRLDTIMGGQASQQNPGAAGDLFQGSNQSMLQGLGGVFD